MIDRNKISGTNYKGSELLKGGILGSRIPDVLDGKSGHFSWKQISGLVFFHILKKNVLNLSI